MDASIADYAEHLTEADMRLISEVAPVPGGTAALLARDPAAIEGLLADPRMFEAVFGSAGAAPVTPQQLTVTAANALGNSIYNMTLTSGTGTALISGATSLNTDGGQHGIFDGLVWVPNPQTNTLDLVAADLLKGQLVKYAGPKYGSSTVISSWSRHGAGAGHFRCHCGLWE